MCIANFSTQRFLRNSSRRRESLFLCNDEVEKVGEKLLFLVWLYEQQFSTFRSNRTICVPKYVLTLIPSKNLVRVLISLGI